MNKEFDQMVYAMELEKFVRRIHRGEIKIKTFDIKFHYFPEPGSFPDQIGIEPQLTHQCLHLYYEIIQDDYEDWEVKIKG